MEIQIIQSTETNDSHPESQTQYFGTILNRVLSNIKMSHWYIKNYNKHQIFGDLYNDLADLFDTLQEEIIGVSRLGFENFPEFDRDSTFHDEELQYYVDDKSIIEHYICTYNSLILVLLSPEFESYVQGVKSGILNTRDEIISRLNKTNYLLNIA